MKLLQKATSTPVVLGILLALVSTSTPVRSSAAPSGVAIRDVRSDGTSVTGWVVNDTSHEVRDVRLMVERQWRWAREMNPGEDNPASGTVVRVEQPIPANGRLEFRYDLPPEPQRNDGHFETVVRVLSFSEHWYEPTAIAPQRTAP